MSEIYGLVLAGGKSIRMGTDKSKLVYHELPHEQHLFNLLSELLPNTYLSTSSEEGNFTEKTIIDQYDVSAPIVGLISAMRTFPDVAWLVLACDLPMITDSSIKNLIEQRDPEAIATVFEGSAGKLEPLAGIWEPAALPLLTHGFDHKEYSLQSILSRVKVKSITLNNPNELFNANDNKDFNQARNLIRQNKS
ncbi:MAG: molybdenum cofactor guanylyltransferase [Bacteroidota bacterium]